MRALNTTLTTTGATDDVNSSGRSIFAVSANTGAFSVQPQVKLPGDVWQDIGSAITAVGNQTIEFPAGSAIRLNATSVTTDVTVHIIG